LGQGKGETEKKVRIKERETINKGGKVTFPRGGQGTTVVLERQKKELGNPLRATDSETTNPKGMVGKTCEAISPISVAQRRGELWRDPFKPQQITHEKKEKAEKKLVGKSLSWEQAKQKKPGRKKSTRFTGHRGGRPWYNRDPNEGLHWGKRPPGKERTMSTSRRARTVK